MFSFVFLSSFFLFLLIKFLLLFVYRVPLVFAVKRCDPRAVRLLLDFGADPNALTPDVKTSPKDIPMQRSLLAIAARFGFYDGIKMLRDRDANIENGSENPILATIQKGNRECFAALIEGHEKDVLKLYQGKSLLYHAFQSDSTLLPLIATLANNEFMKLKNKNKEGNLTFPPSDLNPKQKKKLMALLQYEDSYLPYDVIKKRMIQYRSPYRHVKDTVILGENAEETNDIGVTQTTENQPTTQATEVVTNTSGQQFYNSDSEDEQIMYTMLDDENDVVRTQSDAFDEAPEWIPLSKRNVENPYIFDSDNIALTIE